MTPQQMMFILAVLCKQYGKSNGSGGYNLSLSAEVIASVKPNGQIIQQPPNGTSGFTMTYQPAPTIIDGELLLIEPEAGMVKVNQEGLEA